MLYQFFKYLFIPTIRAYFSSVRIINSQNIPDNGPVILAVNHTSAFMDPILVATNTKRVYHFLARGEAFNSKAAIFFYKQLNMLPVYRPETMPDDVHKNKFVFKQCYEHLSKGKAIMIFPEGFSKTERRIREIKSGMARIALGSEKQNDFSLNVKVIPVGINYSNPHIFRSDVLINIGEAISVLDYKELFNSNEKAAYDLLSETVRKQLEKTTVFISDSRQEVFIESIEWFYKNMPTGNEGSNSMNELDQFDLSKEIVKGVENLADNDPKVFTNLESKVLNYKNRVSRLSLDHARFSRPYSISYLIFELFVLIVGLPVFLLGALSNLLPMFFTSLVTKKIKVREDFIGSLKLTAGMFTFLIMYLLQSYCLSFLLANGLAFLSMILFYASGLFSLYYFKVWTNLKEDIKHYYLSRKKDNFFNAISIEQSELFQLLNENILTKRKTSRMI